MELTRIDRKKAEDEQIGMGVPFSYHFKLMSGVQTKYEQKLGSI